ncbi:uncharacterized protein LOC117173389 [Belonocnema kinseyi]|uniref:uncharacterized protein LOC117173389 n=1 Tax=Belonocnema kinseyi TaxID=2817044 RepID=UPI00143DE5E9|nr:uncharacterized protein LOC117173389 [Belonocnema kinseyi]
MELEDNPIAYWNDMSNVYPDLALIAVKYLSVVATSVPCERLFSKAGYIMDEKRNRMKGLKLHKQLFLNQVNKSLWQTKARKKYQRSVDRSKSNMKTGCPEGIDFNGQNTYVALQSSIINSA